VAGKREYETTLTRVHGYECMYVCTYDYACADVYVLWERDAPSIEKTKSRCDRGGSFEKRGRGAGHF
jgi:hypothetical protein